MVGNVTAPQALQVFKCLSDETRLMLVLLIAQEQELCVCEMTHALQESQPKVSRHLAQLRQCGLLSDQREGQWVYYRLASQLPAWAHDIVPVSYTHLTLPRYAVCRSRWSPYH